MKQLNVKIYTLFLALFLVFNVKASHIMGGDITYKIIDTTTGIYKFKVTLYRDCSGIQFSTEVLEVRSSVLGSINIPLTFLYKEEVTPVCKVPDVPNPIITNCPSGPIVNNMKGIEKWVYEATVTLGKNNGLAYVGWSQCCRNASITTGPANQNMWIQAALNTNYINNSVNLLSDPIPYWCAGTLSTYNFGVLDTIDPNFVVINNVNVKKDSLVYRFFKPFSGEAASATDAFNYQNPIVTIIAPLNAINFLYTTNGVSLNKSTGTITCTPSQEQDAVLAMAVEEWIAKPNANGIGYTRVLAGYITRDIQFTVRSNCTPNQYLGIVADSSQVTSVIDSNTVNTCSNRKTKIVFKGKVPVGMTAKIKDLKTFKSTDIINYNFSKINLSTDTILGVIEFDGAKNIDTQYFNYEILYCNSAGFKIAKNVTIKVIVNQVGLSLNQDTIYYCMGGDTLKLDVSGGKNIKWQPTTGILSAQPIDSSWVKILPTTDIKYYFSNSTLNACNINDSVYIKVINCNFNTGNLFLDVNKNCVKDTNEPNIVQRNININGTNNAYSNTVITDTLGNFSFSGPDSIFYDYKIAGNKFNCQTDANKATFYATNGVLISIPVKDSAEIQNFKKFVIGNNSCSLDSITLNFEYYKNYGNLTHIVYFGNGDSSLLNGSINANNYSYNLKYKYNSIGNFTIKFKLLNTLNNTILYTDSFPITINKCKTGLVYIDMNNNCIYDSSVDVLTNNYKIIKTNINTNSQTIHFTNYNGWYSFKDNSNANIKLEIQDTINCNSNSNNIIINSNSIIDTINIPIKPHQLNFYINIIPTGNVSNTGILNFSIWSNYYYLNILKNYTITIPNKASYYYAYNANNLLLNSNTIKYNNNTNYSKIQLQFDSLVASDTLCFNIRLHRVGLETDTTDNVITMCLPAFTSYDPNDKRAFINSLLPNGDFTEKSDVINYQIRFQNTGNAVAENIVILDTLDPNLDYSTINILNSSHPMSTEMTTNQILSFNFKNILLPDSNSNEEASHGYLTYSIKAKSSLQLNETIKNTAHIYFDYNAPVATNTTVNKYVLKTTNSISNNLETESLIVFPNPAKDYLELVTYNLNKNAIVSIFNIEGKLIKSIPARKKIQITDLETGIYILNLTSDKTTTQVKFIKE